MKNSIQPVVALVAAAGSGSRLGGPTPKPLVEVGGVPLVLRSVRQLAAGGAQRAVIVVPAGTESDFNRALAEAPIPCVLVFGGAERQESVRRGLDACAADGADQNGERIVLVHDAARPLVPVPVVESVITAVRAGHPAVVPVLPMIDSIRRVADGTSAVVDRSELVGVQTPQGFDLATLRAAHEAVAARALEVTDDAACCEAVGIAVHLVAGSRLSLKVTEPTDLVIAEALLAADEA